MSPLPNLLGLGAQRAGTMSLWKCLMQQNACTGFRDKSQGYRFVKEARHFDRKGWRGMKGYTQAFAEAPVKLDYTPSYLYFAKVPGRVKARCPGAKFLVLLRDMAERAISAYGLKWTRKPKAMKQTFQDVITLEIAEHEGYFASLLDGDGDWESPKGFHPVRLGLYAAQLKHWLGYFPASKFCIVDGAWFYINQAETVKGIMAFMEVSDIEETKPLYHNQSDRSWQEQENMDEVREVLGNFYAPWDEELARILDKMQADGATIIPGPVKETEGNGVLHDVRRGEQDTGPAEGPELPTASVRGEDGS